MKLDHKLRLFIVAVLLLSLPMASVYYVTRSNNEITPNDEFFIMQIGDTPSFYMEGYTLKILGEVANPLELEYDDITEMPKTTLVETLKCVSGPSDRAEWAGVRLDYLLGLSGLNSTAREVIFWAADGYSSSLTVDEIRGSDVLLCWEMNGEPLPPDQGFPLKIVVPGHYGYKWVKWVTDIQVVEYDYQGYWESRGWSDDASITPLGEWTVHAYLLSFSYLLCGIVVISGYKIEGNSDTWFELPDFVTPGFHRIMTISFVIVFALTFGYWAYMTSTSRGDLFYTLHGMVALILNIMFGIVIISGFLKRRPPVLHGQAGLFSFLVFTMVIVLGLLLAFGSV